MKVRSATKQERFNRLGEIRGRSFENQRYRAGGLNLIVTAIALWNTVYLEGASVALHAERPNADELVAHLSRNPDVVAT